MNTSAPSNVKGPLVTLAAALAAALASSFCCIGPLLYLLFGVSAAGLTALPGLAWLQIPMIVLAVGLMTRGFWRLYLSQHPVCVKIVSLRTLHVLYWMAVPLLLILVSWPYVLPWFMGISE